MSKLQYVKFERVVLKDHPEYNEKWVQACIAKDPAVLGFGDLILKDKERRQPKAGRLDLLLEGPEKHRYEVEVQLGRTDESHIVRTIEYWDIERKRYPQYDHTAVIVAEDITSRFLNVISLFNGFIPLVAIQMNVLRCEDRISLICTKVLDQMTLGYEDDEKELGIVNRSYWEKRATNETVRLADVLLDRIHIFAPYLKLKYNKFYIGLARDGQPNNFVTFQPQKHAIRVELSMTKSETVETKIADQGLDLSGYTKWGTYTIRLSKTEVEEHIDFLTDLMKDSFEEKGK